jgi:hypothetical protein
MKRVEVFGRALRVTNAVARHVGLLGRDGAARHVAAVTLDGVRDQIVAVDDDGVLLVTDHGTRRLRWADIDELGATWLRLMDGTWVEIRHEGLDEHERFVAAMPAAVSARHVDRIERANRSRGPALQTPVVSQLLAHDADPTSTVRTAVVTGAHLQTVVDAGRGGHVLLLQVEGRGEPLVILHPAAAELPIPAAFRTQTQQGWDDLLMSVQSPGPVYATWWAGEGGVITRVVTTATWLGAPAGTGEIGAQRGAPRAAQAWTG